MERYEVAKFIEALSPYIYINKEALLTNVILNPIDDLPDEMNTVFDKALFAVVWRDIEGDKAGILPHWDERKIVEVTHKISRSGNPAWYCKCEDGKTVYVRQSNKEIMTVPYPAFENMQVGDVVSDVNITIYTTTDGIFLNIEKVIEGGVFAYVGESDSQRKQRVIAGLDELTKDAVYFDVETTGLDESAEIVSIAIVAGDDEYKTFIQPTDIHKLTIKGKGGKSASDINGITEDDIKDAPTFPDVYDEIKKRITSKNVVTYGDFDKRLLRQAIERHSLEQIEYNHIDLMAVYGEYNGSVSGRGGYKYHKLADVYLDVVGTPLDGAHDAMVDTKAMVTIVEELKNNRKHHCRFRGIIPRDQQQLFGIEGERFRP